MCNSHRTNQRETDEARTIADQEFVSHVDSPVVWLPSCVATKWSASRRINCIVAGHDFKKRESEYVCVAGMWRRMAWECNQEKAQQQFDTCQHCPSGCGESEPASEPLGGRGHQLANRRHAEQQTGSEHYDVAPRSNIHQNTPMRKVMPPFSAARRNAPASLPGLYCPPPFSCQWFFGKFFCDFTKSGMYRATGIRCGQRLTVGRLAVPRCVVRRG